MGRVADQAGIQFRLLNRRKGPAVQGPRSQADRKLYQAAMTAEINAHPNLTVIEGEVSGPHHATGDGHGRGAGGWKQDYRRRNGSDDGHVPAWCDPYRRRFLSGGPDRRSAQRDIGRAHGQLRPAVGASENRNTAKTERKDHRLDRAGGSAGRRRSRHVFVPVFETGRTANRVRHHLHERGNARDYPREPRQVRDVWWSYTGVRAAVLPVHRRQGREVCG